MAKKHFGRLGAALLAAALMGTSFAAVPAKTEAADSEPYVWKSVVTGGGGGFVPGIIFNTSEKDLIYARTDIGGAYRWNPEDGSWIPLNDSTGWDDWNKYGVDALATDPVDPDRVYIATGMYTNSWDKKNGQIMRSTDRGNTWESTTLPFKVGGNMPGRSMGERLVIDPNKNSILYFGARSGNGLWRSTDYGETWSQVTNFPNTGSYIPFPNSEYGYGDDPIGLAWITFDPSTGTPGSATQTIYVGVADLNESIYRSTDGGATWTAVPGQPKGYLPHHGVLSGNGKLYITYSDGAGPYDGTKGEVWSFDTKTGEWKDISPVASSSSDNYYGYGGLAVDAQHPDTIMVASLNSWWPDAIIFRSTDGGATWTRIWDWNGYPNRTLRYTQDISAAPWLDFENNPSPPEITPKLGWMIGDLEIDPFNSDRMMYGTGATIYGTNNLTDWDNGGKINITVMAKGIEETAVSTLISPPSGAHLISGVYDVTGFRHDDLDKAPAKMMTNPNSTSSMDYAELMPNFMVRVGSDKTAMTVGFTYSGGSDWYLANSKPSGTTGGGTVAASANATSVVWSTSDVGVYYSKSGGNSWTASQGVPAGAKVASDRVNPNKFYAFSGGNFYVSTDGGATFSKTAASGLPSVGSVNFKAMPGLEGDIWLAGGSDDGELYGLWHSTDSGATFTKLENVEKADVVGFGKAASGKDYMALYISAQIDGVRGVFRSDDAGASWVRINDDAHQYGMTNIAITGDPRIYGRVYLGTNGRGILYADPIDQSQTPTPTPTPTASATAAPTPTPTASATATPTPTPTASATATPTPTPTPTASATAAPTPTPTASATAAPTPTPTASATAAPTPTPTASATATPTPTPTSSPGDMLGEIKVQVYNGNLSASTNSIFPRIKLFNTGSTAINLSDVKLRYYYTVNGDKTQNFFCDWATVGSTNVTGTFVPVAGGKTGADYYLEIGFTSGAGTLAAGQSAEIHARFAKSDWSNYSQSDDYSFDSTGASYKERTSVTGYLSGVLKWGTEP